MCLEATSRAETNRAHRVRVDAALAAERTGGLSNGL